MHYISRILQVVLLLASLPIAAQEYTPAQLQAFTQVFWEMKNSSQPTDRIGSVPGISNERLGQIIKGDISGKKVELTPDEQVALETLRSRNNEYRDGRLLVLESLCTENDIAVEVYNSILKAYRTDIDFQRTLRPYFKTYFEGNE